MVSVAAKKPSVTLEELQRSETHVGKANKTAAGG